ncbi:response regulator, partial [bacterium]|nr:response regulator [bacterium]
GTTQLAGAEPALDSTYGILERGDGRIWVATVDGLARVAGDRIERTRAPDPLLERPIYALAEDRDGRVWIGTDVGVRIWDGRRLATLDARGGLIGSETNRDALMVDRRGRVWIGTDRGVTRHDPALVEPVDDGPPVTITHMTLAGEPVDLDGPLTIPSGVSDLTIDFRSLPFRDERRLRFRTFLEGLDAGWRPAARIPSQSVRYSHLPPGTYRFRVQAVGPHGDGGAIASTPVIDVTPPFWRSWWFRASVALAAIVLMGLSVQVLQGRRYARRLAREVASRTRELAASEQAVRRESQRLSTVLTSISDGVLAVRGDGAIVLGNLAAGDLVGRAVDDLIGQPLDRFFPDLTVALGRGEGRLADPVFAYPFTTPAGEDLDLEVSIAPLAEDDGDAFGWVLAFRDVTDRRRLEQESIRSQKLESLGVLAGGLAHDFNNLMTVVLGHLSVIEEGPALSVGDRASLRRMRDATEQARGLTSQLLTFARGGEPRKQPSDLGELARRTAELVTSGSSCGVDLDLPDDLPAAEVDPGQLEQVFSNLLINARQAMPEGGVIRVRGRAATRGADPRVEITIVDEGPGIAAEIADRIFEPYFTTKDGGSGLGLSICYSIVRRHGGELRVSSPAAGGAAFTVSLPATQARVDDAPPTASTTAAVEGLRVLVLDDEEPVRDIMMRMLEREGHECVGVATGEEAIDAHARALGEGRPYDVVVVDLTIADGMGGAEAFAHIRRREPDVRGIVASGYSHDPIMSHHEQHGFGAALRKPFDRSSLARAVGAVLETAPVSGGDE